MANEAQRQNLQTLLSVLDVLPDATLIVDDHGNIVEVNAIANKVFGYDAGALAGKSIELLVPESSRARHREKRDGYSAAPRVRLMDPALRLSGRRKNGETFPAEIALGPLNTDEGQFIFCTVRDLTDRTHLEERLRRQEAQLLAAEEIQKHLLPQSSPDLPGFDIAGRCYPAEYAGGDQFDYLPQPDGSLIVTIGDVSGHGFAPALLMACLHAHIQSLAKTQDNLSDLVTEANAALMAGADGPYFVSLIVVRIDPATRSLTFVNAGHPFGLVLDSEGMVRHELQSFRVPLGIVEEVDFPLGDPIALNEGDILVLLTDGVVEAMSPSKELFHLDNVLRVVRESRDKTADEIIEALRQAVHEHTGNGTLQDDVTIVIVKAKAAPGNSASR